MKLLLFLLSLLGMVISQQILEQSWPYGNYRSLKKEGRAVPRLYICGAGVWKRREVVPQPPHCQQVCEQKRSGWRRGWRTYTECHDRCDPRGPVHAWTRINGISFQYCHFQNWNQQIYIEETGGWDWQGRIMCPQRQYVYGMRGKFNERDGLAGLILFCRNPNNEAEISERLVFDGEGGWREAVLSVGYATGFKAKYQDFFISGLSLQLSYMPHIISYNFQYYFPTQFHTAPNVISQHVVQNYQRQEMRKQIQLSKQKTFERVWQNANGYLAGQQASSSLSRTLGASAKISVPFFEVYAEASQTQTNTFTTRQQITQSFKFGTVQTYKIGQILRDIITVPGCTMTTIKQIVHTYSADIPYRLELGYTNGFANQFEAVQGKYRGVTAGKSRTQFKSYRIC